MNLDFSIVPAIAPFLWQGVKVTLLLVAIVLVVTAPLALLVALGRDCRLGWLRVSLQYISWVIRGVPPLMILFCVFFIAPQAGLEIDAFPAAVIAMTLFMTFYFAEAIRAGLASVPKGQYQAALALGLPPGRTFGRIVMPQALPSIIPP
ncbi:MAG: ABC transporter permease subunit [Rhizobiaceae bacterium]